MNRGNRKINARAHDLLDPKDGSHVLDLGFGGGLGLDMLLRRGAQVTGIDRAPDMVAAAIAHHPDAIASGRLAVMEGDVTALPLPADSVDGVVTINTVYFWPDLAQALGELGRVLSPGGTLVIGIRDGSVMNNVDREIFTIRAPDEIKASVADAGFEDVQIESPSDQRVHFIVARTPREPRAAG
jgi:ubiquinone/menaquinone biosynthesis C-methylase UbiE